MPLLTVNGTELYYELRGGGPPVLLIMGFTGDAGNFETLADLLADEFTVISYDRRGNGRSPRPAGWASDLPGGAGRRRGRAADRPWSSPAAVYGSSAGANFALCLLIRHPEASAARSCTSRRWCGCSTIRARAGAVTAVVQRRMEAGGPAGGTGAALSLGGWRCQLGTARARTSGAHAGNGRDLLRGRAGEL